MSRIWTDWREIVEAQPEMVWVIAGLGFLFGIFLRWRIHHRFTTRLSEAKSRQKELQAKLAANRGETGNEAPVERSRRRETAIGTEIAGLFLAAGSSVSRVVFVVDVSRSLTPAQFAMSKSELSHGLKSLEPGTQYQVIFFSGPVWFAHQRLVEGGDRDQDVLIRDGKAEHRWICDFGAHSYERGNENLPTSEWRTAGEEEIAATLLDVEEVGKSHGTTWHLPMMMALQLEPPPQRIFFMTDGEISRQSEIASDLAALSRERGAPEIHTVSLMVPGASPALYHLARKSGGNHSLVIAGGHVLREREMFLYLEEKGIELIQD
jgi:hypothetical protein